MKKENILHIIINGNYDKDLENLLKGKINKKTSKNTIYVDSFTQLNSLLSPSKLDLFNYLTESQNTKPKSLTEISNKLKRKKEAISRDIKQLSNLELIKLKKEKQTIYALPKYKKIEIKTA